MTKKQMLALLIALAALFGGFLTHSTVGAATAATLAAVMFYCKFLPVDDSQPTPAQQNIGWAIAMSVLALYVLGMRFYWADWLVGAYSGACGGYFGMIFIMNVLSRWKKK